jgi:hypothetical protein
MPATIQDQQRSGRSVELGAARVEAFSGGVGVDFDHRLGGIASDMVGVLRNR